MWTSLEKDWGSTFFVVMMNLGCSVQSWATIRLQLLLKEYVRLTWSNVLKAPSLTSHVAAKQNQKRNGRCDNAFVRLQSDENHLYEMTELPRKQERIFVASLAEVFNVARVCKDRTALQNNYQMWTYWNCFDYMLNTVLKLTGTKIYKFLEKLEIVTSHGKM